MNERDTSNCIDDGQFEVKFNKEDELCNLNGLPFAHRVNNSENEQPGSNFDKIFEKDETWFSLSGLYAEILIVLAVVTILKGIFHGSLPSNYINDYLLLYLQIVGIVILIIGFTKKLFSRVKSSPQENEGKLGNFRKQSNGLSTSDITSYFKIGAIVFGLVAIINSLLEVASTFITPSFCTNPVSLIQPILRSAFILLQMCFIKNTGEFISSFRCRKNFVLMHLFATNFAIWIRLLLWESVKDWEEIFHMKHNSSLIWDRHALNITIHSLESNINSLNTIDHYPSHIVHYTSSCYWRVQKSGEVDVTSVRYCLQNSTIGGFWGETNQFIFPILSQYYFVIASILYVMWVNLNCKKKLSFDQICSSYKDELCSRSTKGFFLGFIIFITTILNLILFYTVKKQLDMMINIMYCVMFGLSSIAALLGLFQIEKLYFWRSYEDIEINMIFQKIGLFSVFILGCFNIIFSNLSETKNFIRAFGDISMIIQGILQYLFINKVSRKKIDISNSKEKPGRQSVVFLIFCNVSLWIFDLFVTWNHLQYSYQHTYKNPQWLVLMRFVLPVVGFYRYHSSVILTQVWIKTYSQKKILS